MRDQADKLRELVNNKGISDDHELRIYSIVSGKGGVGKTNFTVNLAIKLQQLGKKVLILDADIGMSNVNILMDIDAKHTLLDLLQGKLELEDIIYTGPASVDFMSGGAELLNLGSVDEERQKEIISSLSNLGKYDVLLIDNGAGISKETLMYMVLADEIILVTTPEPTALADAYRVLKAVSLSKLKNNVKVVVNQIPDYNSGLDAYNKLYKTSEQFLKVTVESLGYIFSDIRVNKAIMEQYPFVLSYPNSLASDGINQICMSILGDEEKRINLSGIKQFSNRLIKLFG